VDYLSSISADEVNSFGPGGMVLRDIEPDFDVDLMLAKIRPSSANVERVYRELIEEARSVARPQAVFRICAVKTGPGFKVGLNEILFKSKLLHTNLTGLDQAFAYVATEGPELSGWADSLAGARKAFAWPVRYAALKLAEKSLVRFIEKAFALRQVSSMNPGALPFWPIEEQKLLFEVLDPLPSRIGVVLHPNLWMSPDLSSSGVLFETEAKFYNCQLCSLDSCPHRRIEYLGRAGWPEARTTMRGVQ